MVGVGAVGRQVALQLTTMGAPDLVLIDHDTVEEVNCGSQGWRPDQIGLQKVNAALDDCQAINPELKSSEYCGRFSRSRLDEYLGESPGVRPVVFMCVDSMEARTLIWKSVRERAWLVVDGRMAAEVMRVLAVESPSTDEYYQSTLFPDAEARQEACTAKAVIYCASIVAGFMLAQLTKRLRGFPACPDFTVNLLADELTLG